MKHVYNCSGHALKIPDVVGGEGAYVVDARGNRFLDLEAGVWCLALGHNHPHVKAAMAQQMDGLMHAGFCYSHRVLETSSHAVLSIAGIENGKCVFLCSGSEAVEISRQMAKHATGKTDSMTLHDSYLGAYGSITDRSCNWYLFDWQRCQGCLQKDPCNPDCDVLQDIPETIADFIFEPGSASGFVRFPPPAMIQNIVRIVRCNGGKVIANEVTTGVGRTGRWFGFQHYGIEPDLIAIGKGIGNGYPVSAVAIHPKTLSELESKPFKYAQSHQNDPLGAAVVGAVVHFVAANGLVAEAARKGELFRAYLRTLVDSEIVRGSRGRGLMFALDLVDANIGNEIYQHLINRGYLVGNRGAVLRLDPPLIISEPEFVGFIEAFKDIIAAIKCGG